MKSVGSVLDANKGTGPGFGLLRLLLAVSVIFVHCDLVDAGASAETWWPYGARWGVANLAVPVFFVLSGFLLAGSLARTRVDVFMANRLLRLVPALAVVVLLTGFVVGPLVTSLPLAAYFGDRSFPSYFLNILGRHQDTLPGVFDGNPEHLVNGSLWTLSHEASCYILLSILAVLGVFQRRSLVLALTIGLYGAANLLWLVHQLGLDFPMMPSLVYVFETRGAARLVPLFLVGVLAWQYRAAIPLHWLPALLSAAGLVAVAMAGNQSWAELPPVWVLTAPMFAYLAIYLGLAGWFTIPLLVGADYSYGIYLYGYTVQQTLLHLMPGFHDYWLFFAVSLVPTVFLAMLSWHLVEKPALDCRHALRGKVTGAVDRIAAVLPDWLSERLTRAEAR
ncbi:MAG: acyltransferase [Bosea sp.]|nr:acyltransferase [Bosea sp. (in: a-proteobacteria)]